MKRRGFLGFLAGGAVAGPSMVKQAAAATVADLNLSGIATMGSQFIGGGEAPDLPPHGNAANEVAGWIERAAKIGLRSKAEHAHRIQGGWINGLDPDLAVNRSMALHAKIAIQKRRNYWRQLEDEKSWLQRRIDGIMDW